MLSLEQLNARIEALENKQVSLPYPLSFNDREILRGWLKQDLTTALFDSLWTDIFHFSTIFEGLDGYNSLVTGTGVATIAPDGLYLSTGATALSTAEINRYPDPTFGSPLTVPFITWKQPSRFKTNFVVSATTNQEGWIVIGSDPSNAALPYYGFKIDDNKLYGCSRKTSAGESIIELFTLVADTIYIVEARHSSGESVDFYVKNSTTNVMELAGRITTIANIPGSDSTNHNGFFAYHLNNKSSAENKALDSSYFEYIQLKDRF